MGHYLTRNIEGRAGSKVLALEEHNPAGELVLRDVEEVFERVAYQLQIVTIRSSSGVVQTIQTMAEHPVYGLGQGWTSSG